MVKQWHCSSFLTVHSTFFHSRFISIHHQNAVAFAADSSCFNKATNSTQKLWKRSKELSQFESATVISGQKQANGPLFCQVALWATQQPQLVRASHSVSQLKDSCFIFWMGRQFTLSLASAAAAFLPSNITQNRLSAWGEDRECLNKTSH